MACPRRPLTADLAERYLRALAPSDVVERIEGLEVLARARIDLGDVAAADAAAVELESVAQAIPTVALRASAAAVRAEVLRAQGHVRAARVSVEAAIDGLDRAGLAHDEVRARLGLAALQLDSGEPGPARRTAETAHAAAVALGAAREVAAAADLLRQTRTTHDSSPDGLTPREVEVLQLVADGLSNTEIAGRLVLSPRTVERHMSNIYLKVGATGTAARTVAVAHGRRTGLLT